MLDFLGDFSMTGFVTGRQPNQVLWEKTFADRFAGARASAAYAA